MKDLMELVQSCDILDKAEDPSKVQDAIDKANELQSLGFKQAAGELMKRATMKARLGKVAEHKYVQIKDENIKKYLESLAKEYNEKHAVKKRVGKSLDLDTSSLLEAMQLFKQNERRQQAYGEYSRSVYVKPDSFYWTNNTTLPVMFGSGAQLTALEDGTSWDVATPTGAFVETDAPAAPQVTSGGDRRYPTISASTIHASSLADGTIGRYAWTEVPVETYKGIPPKDVLVKMAEHKARNIFDYFTVGSVNAVKDPLLMGRVDGLDARFFLAQWGDDVSLDDVI